MADIYFEDELLKEAFEEKQKQDNEQLRMDKYRESVKLAKEFCEEAREKSGDLCDPKYRAWAIAFACVQECLDWLVGGCDFNARAFFKQEPIDVSGETQLLIVVSLDKYETGRSLVIPIEHEMSERIIKRKIAKMATAIEEEHIHKLLGADYE